jgi:hypothetical protein
MFGLIWIATKISVFMAIYGLVFAKLVRKPDADWVKQRLLPVSILMFAAGLILPNIWFYWALFFVLLPVISRSRSEAVCLFVLMMLVTPFASRQMGVGGIYLMNFDKYLFAGMGLIVTMFMRPAKGRGRIGWFDLPFILLIILALIETRGSNFTSTLRAIVSFSITLAVPYFIISRSLRQPEDMRRLLFTIAFAGFFLSCEAVYEWRIAFLPYELISQHLGATLTISAYSKSRSGGLRAATAFPESTSFGLFLVIAFLATLCSHDAFRNQRSRMLALIVVLAGLYASNARSPLIALTLAVLARDFYRKRLGAMMGKIVLIGGLVVLGLALAQVSPAMADRFGISGSSVGNTDYRKLLYRRGMEQIGHHPVLGVSSSQAYTELADLRQGEGIVDFVNAYIYYGMIAGVGGILILLSSFYAPAIKMLEIRKRISAVPGLIPIGALVFSVVLFTSVSAFTSGFGSMSYFIFYVVLAVGSALNSRPRSLVSQPQNKTTPEFAAPL